jgi:hypothetical protein
MHPLPAGVGPSVGPQPSPIGANAAAKGMAAVCLASAPTAPDRLASTDTSCSGRPSRSRRLQGSSQRYRPSLRPTRLTSAHAFQVGRAAPSRQGTDAHNPRTGSGCRSAQLRQRRGDIHGSCSAFATDRRALFCISSNSARPLLVGGIVVIVAHGAFPGSLVMGLALARLLLGAARAGSCHAASGGNRR